MSSHESKRKLAALLAADMVGYSRLTGIDEEGTIGRVQEFRREVVEPAVAAHDGRVVKTIGDGYLIEFASAVSAVRCAVDIQRGAHLGNADLSDGARMEFRMGINVGDVIVDGDDLLGDGVNVAARLEGIAAPGAICLSESAYQQVRDKVSLAFADQGEKSLKNILRPVRVYQLKGDVGVARSRDALPLPDKPSIAVLAFLNLSGDSEQEYFADGVVEDIITALSRFKHLFVIARNSSFAYKGRNVDVKLVGRELGVRYVLEGSVRKSGARVRIACKLIDVATNMHIWADRFDGELADIFDLQDEVTTRVVGAILPQLERAEIERAQRKPTHSLEAYDFYLQGLAIVNEMTSAANTEARALFRKAFDQDPAFSLAYGWAARCYVFRRVNGWMTNRAEEMSEASRLARLAAQTGPDDALALSLAGYALGYVAGELDEALTYVDRALKLNSNVAAGWGASGWLKMCLGEHETAIEHGNVAIRLSPFEPHLFTWQAYIAVAHFYLDRYEEAISISEKLLREQPNYLPLLRISAASNALAGHMESARASMLRVRELAPLLRISSLSEVIVPLRRAEDRAKYAEGLRRAGLPE